MSSELAVVNQSTDIIFDVQKFEHTWRVATAFSKSTLVPVAYQGKPENVFLAFHLAHRLGIDPIMAMNNVHVVHGNPGLSAQLAIALATKCGAFETPITYEEVGAGDKLAVIASAKLRGGPVVSERVSWDDAVRAGWTRMKDGGTKPFWAAKPAYMLKKRAATFLIRTYAPDVLLGFRTDEEWEDVGNGLQAPTKNSLQSAASVVTEALQNVTPVVEKKEEPAKPTPTRGKKATPPPPAPMVVEEMKTEEKPQEEVKQNEAKEEGADPFLNF